MIIKKSLVLLILTIIAIDNLLFVVSRHELEDYKRLSESIIWKLSSSFYTSNGVKSWTEKGGVPSYISSNSFTAKRYAQLIRAYIQDFCSLHVTNKELNLNEKLYIIELGSGLGSFSYRVILFLEEMKNTFCIPFHNIVYVMTDFTKSNIDSWFKNKKLKYYFNSGRLDAAVFNAVNDNEINLIKSKITLKSNFSSNPIIIIANYLFDTIPQDFFHYKKGKMHEVLLSTGSKQFEKDYYNPQIITRLDNKYRYNPINYNYYQSIKMSSYSKNVNNQLDNILNWYVDYFNEKNYDKVSILIPNTGINCINNLLSFSKNNEGLLIIGDQGYNTPDGFSSDEKLDMLIHKNTFSLKVNFHSLFLLSQNFENSFMISNSISYSPFNVNLLIFNGNNNRSNCDNNNTCSSSINSSQYSHLLLSYEDNISFGPMEFNYMKLAVESIQSSAGIPMIFSFFKLCDWDPETYYIFHSKLKIMITKETSKIYIDELKNGIDRLLQLFVPTTTNFIIVNDIATLFASIGLFKESAKYYEYYNEITNHNDYLGYSKMGVCYFYCEQYEKAVKSFKKSLLINPKATDLLSFISKAENKLRETTNDNNNNNNNNKNKQMEEENEDYIDENEEDSYYDDYDSFKVNKRNTNRKKSL